VITNIFAYKVVGFLLKFSPVISLVQQLDVTISHFLHEHESKCLLFWCYKLIAMNWYGHWGQVAPCLFTNDLTVGSDGIRP
jgi:hypothetical protein